MSRRRTRRIRAETAGETAKSTAPGFSRRQAAGPVKYILALQPAVEACDDGNFQNDDGCSVACTASSGCGNGVVDPGEECDDGNASSQDACVAGCRLAACGDGFVRTGHEVCDDGNTASDDGCSAICTLEPRSASGAVGGLVLTVTTDSEHDGATPGHPIETSVTAPPGTTAGSISIVESPAPPGAPPGFAFMGTLVQISLTGITPAPTPASPVTIEFLLDASQLPAGQNETTVEVHKDGVAVPPCSGAPGHAEPDPCVSTRERQANGNVRLLVATTSASSWTSIGNLCGVAPLPACRGDVAGKSTLLLQHGTKTKLTWTWKGAATTASSLFGNPLADADQLLCVYDANGLALYATAPAAGTCGRKPCWKQAGSSLVYANPALAPDGLSKLVLKSGEAGKAKITIKGTGALLHLPSLPLTLPVRAQVRSLQGACFESRFPAAIHDDAGQFKAKSQ